MNQLESFLSSSSVPRQLPFPLKSDSSQFCKWRQVSKWLPWRLWPSLSWFQSWNQWMVTSTVTFHSVSELCDHGVLENSSFATPVRIDGTRIMIVSQTILYHLVSSCIILYHFVSSCIILCLSNLWKHFLCILLLVTRHNFLTIRTGWRMDETTLLKCEFIQSKTKGKL